MEGGKANCYAALQGGGGGSKFCQKVRYVTVERSLIDLFFTTVIEIPYNVFL